MQVGDTVSLRVAAAEGPREVLGIVVAAASDVLTVRRRDGQIVDVAVSQITHQRVVPPGPARRIPVDELERICAGGWRALETEALGSWMLRASGGFTRRGNSALTLGDPGRSAEAALDTVTDWYAARGLRPRVLGPLRAEHDLPIADSHRELAAALDRRGWEPEAPTHVMTAEVGHALRAVPAPEGDARVDAEPDASWLEVYRADTPGGVPPVARDLLLNHDEVGFASIRDGDRCAAIARATVDGRWVGLTAVEVVPDARGRGLGAAVSALALRWAGTRGARHACLNVMVDNAPAIAVYARLGFVVHHDYEYRASP